MAGALFFDIAPNLTGYCVGDGAQAPVADAWRFPNCGADYGALSWELGRWVRALCDRHDPDVMGYETPLLRPHDKLHTLRRTYGLGMEVERLALEIGEVRGRPLICKEVDLRQIKNLTTGNPHASKPEVAKAVEAAGIPIIPRTIEDGRHDAADAAGGWVWILDEVDPAAASPWIARFRGSLL